MNHIIFEARQVHGLKQHKLNSFCLDQVNFKLPYGYIMGIVGENGAGKTTFFDYIMNSRKRYSGEFLLEGNEIHQDHLSFLNQVGFISEENSFLSLRSAEQNAKMLGRFFSEFRMDTFLKQMEDSKLSANKNVGKMSRGEFMKFQLAFAMAHNPKLLLLDEATAGMDPVFRLDFYKTLRQLLINERCSVIMSTHIEEEIDKQLDYVGLLENGRFQTFDENA